MLKSLREYYFYKIFILQFCPEFLCIFLCCRLFLFEPGHEKLYLMSYANNKGADQLVHLHSLISAFVVHCLDSVMSLVSVTKNSSLMLGSVGEQASLSLTWSETPEDTFSHDEAHLLIVLIAVLTTKG